MGRLARVSPEVIDCQHKSGLSRDDMQASLAKLKALREKASASIFCPEPEYDHEPSRGKDAEVLFKYRSGAEHHISPPR